MQSHGQEPGTRADGRKKWLQLRRFATDSIQMYMSIEPLMPNHALQPTVLALCARPAAERERYTSEEI